MVRGATTTAKLEGKSVVVTVTSEDRKVASKIQMRAEKLLANKATDKPAGEPTPGHAQNGMHGGDIGICPVHVPEGANAKEREARERHCGQRSRRSRVQTRSRRTSKRASACGRLAQGNPMGEGDGTGGGGGSGNGNGSGDAHHGHRHN